MQIFVGCGMAGVVGKACGNPTMRSFGSHILGFNLIAWEESSLAGPKYWKRAIDDIYELGARRVTIVPYALFSPEQGMLVNKSDFGLISGPSLSTVIKIIIHARAKQMSVGLKPMIEIDNKDNEGEIWRGKLRLRDGAQIEKFFDSYEEFMIKQCRAACQAGLDRFYIGTELAGLIKNKDTHPYWDRLIKACRHEIGQSQCRLTYAANYDEYNDVPFWNQLDEIGIDAYFPLATKSQAQGFGHPDQTLLVVRFKEVLEKLRLFSMKFKRPVMLAEWGVVPLDLTTSEPSDHQPSLISDPEEALNAYGAMVEAVRDQSNWLQGVDLWHWRVSPSEDSNYRIDPNGPFAHLLRKAIAQ
jgi:hypothetical protein